MSKNNNWYKDAFGSDSDSDSDSDASDAVDVEQVVSKSKRASKAKTKTAPTSAFLQEKKGKKRTATSSDSTVPEKAKSAKKRKLRKGGDASSGSEDSVTGGAEEKDDFIDNEGDNEDIIKEYAAQREYESDEDPYRDDERAEGQIDEEEEDDPDANPLDRALKRLKKQKGRRQKKKLTDQEKHDYVLRRLRKMDEAYESDAAAVRSGKPGVSKLKLLPRVLEDLTRRELQDPFLERNVMALLKNWIKPLPNGSLPNLKLRSAIIDVVKLLPIERDHLGRSGFGKVVAFLRDHKQETRENRAKLTSLIQFWSRGIFKTTADFRQLDRIQRERNEQHPTGGNHRKRNPGRNPPAKAVSALARGSASATNDDGRLRAQIPQARSFNFTRRPEQPERPFVTISKAGDNKNSARYKLKQKLAHLRKPSKKNARAVKMSIEGRR